MTFFRTRFSNVALLPIACVFAMAQTPAHVPPCKAVQLSATEDRSDAHSLDGGLGHHARTIAIQNRSSSSWALQGIPAATFLGAGDHPVSVPVCANCPDYLFSSQPVEEILLEPKGSAYVVVGYNINNGAQGEIPCRTAVAFSLQLKGQREALRFSIPGPDGWRSCGGVNVTPFMAKPPVDGFLPDHYAEPTPR